MVQHLLFEEGTNEPARFGHRKVLERPAQKLATSSWKHWFDDSKETQNYRAELHEEETI